MKKQIVDNDQYLRELFKENLPKVVVTPLEATYLVWIDLSIYLMLTAQSGRKGLEKRRAKGNA